MRRSTGKPTKAQLLHFGKLQFFGCCACRRRGLWRAAEIHHLVDKGTRKLSGGHDAVLPLCAWHHRGVPDLGVRRIVMERVLGPSMALEKRAFVEEFGSERELLAWVQECMK
jgi:hypothetical protein